MESFRHLYRKKQAEHLPTIKQATSKQKKKKELSKALLHIFVAKDTQRESGQQMQIQRHLFGLKLATCGQPRVWQQVAASFQVMAA